MISSGDINDLEDGYSQTRGTHVLSHGVHAKQAGYKSVGFAIATDNFMMVSKLMSHDQAPDRVCRTDKP